MFGLALGMRSPQFEGLTTSYNVGALIILIGFWGTLYYIYSKEPPK